MSPPDRLPDPQADRLPDFLIVGAMKCGTTTLQAQLAAQPGIFMTTPKEPNFFSDDAVFARGMDWYRGLFAKARPGDLKGEASTHYTKRPTHPDTIARARPHLPSVRLVYMIRNPLERAVSHYIHEWSQARMGADPVAEFARHPELVDYGRYAWQIAPWIEAYGRDAVLLTSLEQLAADPQGELARVARHIGLAGPVAWRADLGAQNVSAERVRKFPLERLLIANPVATALRRALVPKAVRTAIRNRRRIEARPALPADLRDRLQARFLQDRDDLARQFPGHPALRLCYPFAAQPVDG